jgi:hypothetical protein
MPLFPAAIDLATLNGTDGFRLDGVDAFDRSGRAVAAAGDVNGDGFGDLVIGAYGANGFTGRSYVVFGKVSGFGASFDLASLTGSNGFRLDGIDANDRSGISVASAGDVNGDGYGDILIGASQADPGGDSSAGESYVVFGAASGFAATLGLSTLDGTNGLRLDGIDIDDRSGAAVSAIGDFNGDGFGDIVIGAPRGDPVGDSAAGESYVVFGKAGGFTAAIDLAGLDGSNGFRLEGIDPDDASGYAVAAAGDVNGDGIADLLIGASGADPGGDDNAGETYVVFGTAAGFSPAVDLAALDGFDGFRVDGIDPGDRSGWSVAAAGDVNGDGFGDIAIGAYGGDRGGATDAGESYVVFGRQQGFPAAFDLATLDGTNGFRLVGIHSEDNCGFSVSAAGDMNGDGFGDIIVGARYADPGGTLAAGQTYVVFGKAAGMPAALDLANLNGGNGFQLDGIDQDDQSGISVSTAGDINGDGFADIIIGAYSGDPGGDTFAGESYVVFGHANGTINRTGSDARDTFVGGEWDDTFNALGGDDWVRAGDGDDTISGGAGDDTIDGGAGSDTMSGGSGDDQVKMSFGFDETDAGSGKDTLDFRLLSGSAVIDMGLGTYTLSQSQDDGAFSEVEQVIMTNGGDTVTGSSRNDIIQAAKGNDTVNGGAGNDFIAGNYGRDTLTGGLGNDTFDYNALSESSTTSSIRDIITDFKTSGADKIDLGTLDANATIGGNQAFSFLTTLGAAFTAAGQVRYTQSGGNTFVDVNTDANLATIEMQIQLTGLKTLVTADFVL